MTTLRRIAMSWLAGRGPSATAVLLIALVVVAGGCHREAAPPSHRLTSPGFSDWAGSAASAAGASAPAARAGRPQAAMRCM